MFAWPSLDQGLTLHFEEAEFSLTLIQSIFMTINFSYVTLSEEFNTIHIHQIFKAEPVGKKHAYTINTNQPKVCDWCSFIQHIPILVFFINRTTW